MKEDFKPLQECPRIGTPEYGRYIEEISAKIRAIKLMPKDAQKAAAFELIPELDSVGMKMKELVSRADSHPGEILVYGMMAEMLETLIRPLLLKFAGDLH